LYQNNFLTFTQAIPIAVKLIRTNDCSKTSELPIENEILADSNEETTELNLEQFLNKAQGKLIF